MNRQEMINKMEWLNKDSGTGLGICSVANSLAWGMMEPTEEKPDWKSVVFIKGPQDKYTDEEIEKLYGISQRYTAYYDEMFNVRMGANIIIFDKIEYSNKWLRKRMSWNMGQMYSDTLDDAIKVFDEYITRWKD